MRHILMLLFTTGILACGMVARAGDNPDFHYLQPADMPSPKGSFGLGVVIDPGYRLAFLTPLPRWKDYWPRRTCPGGM